MTNSATFRILDAAANRAGEGLRVVEEYARFALDDRFLTAELKGLRHDLAAALAELPAAWRLAARDTLADVGTTVTTPSETHRPDARAVAAASCQRLQQSLRTIEEYAKPLSAALAATCEQLRYRAYTLEKAIQITTDSRTRLLNARLYVLLDGRADSESFARLARTLIAAGADLIQLRDKQLPDRVLLTRAKLLRAIIDEQKRHPPQQPQVATSPIITDSPLPSSAPLLPCSPAPQSPPSPPLPSSPSPHKPLFIMNDRPDLAVLARADGVHLGQVELSVSDARRIVGTEMLVGVSTHAIEQARQAVLDGANYIGVGPTFPSRTKAFTEFPGLDCCRAVAAEIGLPAFAIGGITLENLPQVLATGITRVAVGSAAVEAGDAGAACSDFRRLLGEA